MKGIELFEKLNSKETDQKRFMDMKPMFETLYQKFIDFTGWTELTEDRFWDILDSGRDYWWPNYYGNLHLVPEGKSTGNVLIYETRQEFQEKTGLQFICPSCGGISTDPQTCNSGIVNQDGTACNWKAYGLFSGPYYVIIKEWLNEEKPRLAPVPIFRPESIPIPA